MICPNCYKTLVFYGNFKEGQIYGCTKCNIEMVTKHPNKMYSMRAQGINKSDATFVNFTLQQLETFKEEYRKKGFSYFVIGDNTWGAPSHDTKFESKIEQAMRLLDLVENRVESYDIMKQLLEESKIG